MLGNYYIKTLILYSGLLIYNIWININYFIWYLRSRSEVRSSKTHSFNFVKDLVWFSPTSLSTLGSFMMFICWNVLINACGFLVFLKRSPADRVLPISPRVFLGFVALGRSSMLSNSSAIRGYEWDDDCDFVLVFVNSLSVLLRVFVLLVISSWSLGCRAKTAAKINDSICQVTENQVIYEIYL